MKVETMRTKKAFTLIELLVVISIIALLISILLPVRAAGSQAGQDGRASRTFASRAFSSPFTPLRMTVKSLRTMARVVSSSTADAQRHPRSARTCSCVRWRRG